MKTLYVTDLDGTLLNNGSFVSARSSSIISELSHEGALITVATARTPATVVPIMEGTYTRVPFIVMTGAATYDRDTNTYQNIRSIPKDDIHALNWIYTSYDTRPFEYHYVDGRELVVFHEWFMNDREKEFYNDRRNLPLKRFSINKFEYRESDELLFYFAIGPRDIIIAIADEIRNIGCYSVSCYPDIFADGDYMLEVFTHGVSKADALLKLKEQVGADRVVAFGDNLNDIPMLDVADLAVAVGNAHPQVKEAADIVIGPNYDDAVAKFIYDDFHSLH